MEDRGLLNKNVGEVEADRSIAKIVVLAAIGVIFCFLFGYFLKLFILNSSNWQFLLFSFLTAVGFLIFYLLDVFFIKTFWIIGLTVFLETLAFLAPFYDRISATLMAAAFVSFLILVSGDYLGRRELENMLKIKFWRISKKTVPKAVIALALFVGAVYVAVPGIGQIEQKEFFISQPTFEKIISPFSNVSLIQQILPGFNLSSTVEELVNNLAAGQVKKIPQANLLPEAAKKQLINQATKDFEKQFSDFVGTPVNPQAKVSEVIYEIMVQKFTQLPDNIKTVIPIGAAAIIFLIIIGFTLPIRWLATCLAYLIYEIFLALGFSATMMEGRSREIIILK